MLHWILRNGKWHAWPKGGRRSMCGRINVEHLRETPAEKIVTTLPSDAIVCTTCGKKTHLAPAPVSGQDAIIGAWLGHLRRHLTRVHLKVSEANLQLLAERLAEVGPPDTKEAQDVFEQVRILLLTPHFSRVQSARGRTTTVRTLPHLKEALSKLPPTTKALARVAATLRMWRNITQRDPSADRFRADRVIEVMLQLPPGAEAYIQHLHAREFSHLSSMFHPNTLERSKKDTALRGLFAGSTEYWNQSEDQLNIVTD